MAKSAKTPQPCTCSKFEILVNLRENGVNGDLIWDEEITTNCGGRTTLRTFAPGHDARLKGYLIRAGIEGHEVRFVDGGMAVSSDAITMAEKYGFGQQVRKGIVGGLLKREIRLMKNGDAGAVARGNAAQATVDARNKTNASLADTVAAEEATHAAKELAARQAQQAQADEEWADAHTDEDKAKYADPSEPQPVKAKVGRWTQEGVVIDGVFHYEVKGVSKTATKFTIL